MSNNSKKARTVRFTQTGGPEVLTIETLDIPAPGPQEVRIQVKAIGINRADTMYRRGLFCLFPPFPAPHGCRPARLFHASCCTLKNLSPHTYILLSPSF